MASSSSQVPQIKHDIFISFRGTDTRSGFVSHLTEALRQKKIDVYVDDRLEGGDEISVALIGAIKRSQISLVVFSRHYASSKWCLDELVEIMDCRKRYGQEVIPIFYHVEPSYVRHLKGSYGDAFTKHGERGKDNMVKVCNWGIALNEAAGVSGFHSSNFRTEAEFINKIVERVLKRLEPIYMGQNDSKVLVGIHEKVSVIESLLALGLEGVHVVGIWGMGGIGKTTIAKELYNRLRFEYETCCFMPNVRESLQRYGVTLLQNELLCALLEEKNRSKGILLVGCQYNTMRLRCKKVLLVLDDVNDLKMLRNLYGGHDWFGHGSRIILTSRDKQMLTNVVDDTYEVKALEFQDSLQLFSLHAFKENYPKPDWVDLSMRAVGYAKGIPLAIEVLGSALFGQDKKVWESQLEKLKKMPLQEIQNVLRLSYDGLDQEEQDIFLYLACFFNIGNYDINEIVFLLDDCGYSTHAGLTKLFNKALLNHLLIGWAMHDLISDMGKEVVRGESRDPGSRRHLWELQDVYQALENDMGTKAIQSLTLDMTSTSKELQLNPKAFNGMFNLKFLELITYDRYSGERKIFAPKSLESMPTGLRLLRWKACPLKCLPSSFCAENLFELDLSNSCLERLWDGVENIVKLKKLILSGCEQLVELPDLSKALNLEHVEVNGCLSLCDLHPSILSLHSLKWLGLGMCKKLKSLWSDIYFKSQVELCTNDCSSDTGITKVNSFRLASLPHNFLQVVDFWNLRKLTLDFFTTCYCLQWLRDLYLDGTNIESLPTSIKHLLQLFKLDLRDCKKLRYLPELPPSVNFLYADNCESLEHVAVSTFNLYSGSYQFSFMNCWRLHQQTIMSKAFVMMKRLAYIQWLHGCEFSGLSSVCLPGSKVPAEYKYQFKTTTEATMTLQLSSLSNFLGLICYVVFSQSQIQHFHHRFKFTYYLQTSNVREAEFKKFESTRFPIECDSYHVFLCQDLCISLSNIANIIQSSVENHPKLSVTITLFGEMKLKKWGICPIYASDLFNFRDQLALGAKTKRHRDADIQPLPPAKKFKTQWNTSTTSLSKEIDDFSSSSTTSFSKEIEVFSSSPSSFFLLFFLFFSFFFFWIRD